MTRRRFFHNATDLLLSLAIVFAFVGTIAALIFVPAYMEARAYERVTGKQVSTWDAVWLKLRVEGCDD